MRLTLLTLLSSVSAATITVQVGAGGQRVYEPEAVSAQLGDIVNFQFAGGNHTATQSTFANPCANQGFRSGFRPASATNTSTFAIMINSTEPIWIYCAQTGHCQAGMVMSINAPSTGNRTHAAFKALAQGQAPLNGTNPSGGTSGGGSSIPSSTDAAPNISPSGGTPSAGASAAASSGAALSNEASTGLGVIALAFGVLL